MAAASRARITRSTFFQNEAQLTAKGHTDGNGGGVYSLNAKMLEIEHSSFDSNQAGLGAGISCSKEQSPCKNSGDENPFPEGLSINTLTSILKILGCLVSQNKAGGRWNGHSDSYDGGGGGLHFNALDSVVISDTRFQSNTADAVRTV